jgi:hypothetical protein
MSRRAGHFPRFSFRILTDDKENVARHYKLFKRIGFQSIQKPLIDKSYAYCKLGLGRSLAIEIFENRTFSSLRRTLRRGTLDELVEVLVSTDDDPNENHQILSMDTMSLLKNLDLRSEVSAFQTTISCKKSKFSFTDMGSIDNSSPTPQSLNASSEDLIASSVLHEIALPMGGGMVPLIDALIDDGGLVDHSVPGCYAGPPGSFDANGPVLRLVPSCQPSLVLRIDRRISELTPSLHDSNIGYDDLGHTGAGNIQRQLQLPSLSCLDIRLTDSAEVSRFYVEGTNAVLDGTLASIQSERVLGGDESVLETKYGGQGDCWSEVRALARKVVANPAATLPSFNKQKRVSKPPSIVE